MKHQISFLKARKLVPSTNGHLNENLANALAHECAEYGFALSQDLLTALSAASGEELAVMYTELSAMFEKFLGQKGQKYTPVYPNFPQEVFHADQEDTMEEIHAFWVIMRENISGEEIKYETINLGSEEDITAIFHDLVYAPDSVSAQEKEMIMWFVANGYDFHFDRIRFSEIKAFVGKLLLDDQSIRVLPTLSATTVLRTWAAYSGGDEGLKTNTRFRSPSTRQKKVILRTLDACTDLEDSFKTYRETWLRLLHYLHPGAYAQRWPRVAQYTEALSNRPETLTTFNAQVEQQIADKSENVFKTLQVRPGVFSRRLDHLVRVFGPKAVEEWAQINPSAKRIVEVHNHFIRRTSTTPRSVVLPTSKRSRPVVIPNLEAMPEDQVHQISQICHNLLSQYNTPLRKQKVFVDDSLFYQGLAVNKRAAATSLVPGSATGKLQKVDPSRTIRMYVHWTKNHDIDLSGFIINPLNSSSPITKIGWNSRHYNESRAVVYSGDNTGRSDKSNSEYLDITPSLLPTGTEWVVADAVIFAGRDGSSTYKDLDSIVRAGFVLHDTPQVGTHWKPDNTEHSILIESDSRNSWLLAYHVPTEQIVYLDVASNNSSITDSAHAAYIQAFLGKLVGVDVAEGLTDLRLGHILQLLAGEVVDDVEAADIVFDANTSTEKVVAYL